jgi:hypothetical protein
MDLEEALMRIVGGFDIHRRQSTFDYLDERSGETRRGRIAPADRMLLRSWLQKLVADTGTSAASAVEGCTGRRFVVEELQRVDQEASPERSGTHVMLTTLEVPPIRLTRRDHVAAAFRVRRSSRHCCSLPL